MNALQMCLNWLHENKVDYEGVINEDGTVSIIHDGTEDIFNEYYEHIDTLYDVTDLSRYLRYHTFKHTVRDMNGVIAYVGENEVATFNKDGAKISVMDLNDSHTYYIAGEKDGQYYRSYRRFANDMIAIIDGGMFAITRGYENYVIVNYEGSKIFE